MQKYDKASSEIDYARLSAFAFDRAKGSRNKVFRCPATIQNTGAVPSECAHDRYLRRKCIDWQTSYMPLPKKLNPIDCKNIIKTLIERILLNGINLLKMVLSLISIDWVFMFKMKRNTFHSV